MHTKENSIDVLNPSDSNIMIAKTIPAAILWYSYKLWHNIFSPSESKKKGIVYKKLDPKREKDMKQLSNFIKECKFIFLDW